MFEILLTACLANADICAERMIPASYTDQATCAAEAPDRAEVWANELDLIVKSTECASRSVVKDRIPALDVVEVAEGVFVHKGGVGVPNAANGGDLANLGFVIGSQAVAVIDAGTTRGVAERLYAAIRAQTDLPIRYLLLTHMHPDHSLGAAVFREAEAEILGHPNLAQGLANRADSYETALARLIGAEGFLGTKLIGPDRAVTREELDLGGRKLLLESQSFAHTETDMTVLDQTSGVWFLGDLVFAEHTPALDGTILGWQKLIDELALRKVTGIVPGHGPALLPWPEGAAAMRAYLAAITEETRKAIAEGQPMSSAVRKIGESQRANWKLFDEFNIRNATAAFKELEWE